MSSQESSRDDTAFLDWVFDQAVERLQERADVCAAVFASGREHLYARIEDLIRLARQIAIRPTVELPTIPGYTLLRELGRGGMGAVYLARQERLAGRLVALKLLPPSIAMSPRARERFRDESRAIARLSHPNIIAIYDVVFADHLQAYAMEFIDGRTLAAWISDLAAITPGVQSTGGGAKSHVAAVCDIGVTVARALMAVHAAGLLHRDIKPSNILLRNDGTPVLSDFGLAREIDATLTQPGQFVGTAAYAPPEQLRGDIERIDRRSDVYALGATLYHALALQPPFEGHDPHRLLQQMQGAGPRPLRRLNPRIPRDLATVVEKAMESDPARRYQTAGELADDLERVRTLRPIRARPPGPLTRVLKLVRRRRGVLGAAIGGAALSSMLLTLLGVYVVLVPGWVDAHVRAARLKLVDPAQGVNIASVQIWGRVNLAPPKHVEAWERMQVDALAHYDAALRLAPFDTAIRQERSVVEAAVRGQRPPAQDARSTGLYAFLRWEYAHALSVWETYETQRDPQAELDALVSAALGIMYLFGESPARAYPRLRDACRELPNVGFLTTYHAEAALRCGDVVLAETLLAAAAEMPMLDPGGALERVRAGLRAAQGRDAEAEALYRALPWNAVAAAEYGDFLRSRGRVEEALLHCRSAFQSATGLWTGRRLITVAEEWWASLSPEERRQHIRIALDESPEAPESLVALLREYRAAAALHNEPDVPRSTELTASGCRTVLGDVLSSASLENLSLSDLIQRMEAESVSELYPANP